jgi:hypothetical protein
MTTTTEPMTLSEQLAAAEAAARPARERVAALQAELSAAIGAAEYARAGQLQTVLTSAREALAIAEAAVVALRDGAQRIERQRAEDAQAIEQARQRDQAESDLAAASAAEEHALEQLGDALAAMWNAVGSAQRFHRAALAAEHAVNAARGDQITARARRGDWPSNHPGPTPAKANTASGLAGQDPLVSALARWSPR